MDKVEENLINNLKKFNLIGKKLIVGVSGGGDSTSLLIALSEIKKIIPKIYFEAFHVNYGLRIESNNDEEFVKKICKKLKVKITTKNIKKEKINLRGDSENELRAVRYELISSYVLKSKSYCLLTGHNLNDHIETFLMKLSRGAGLKGMEGINYFSTLGEFQNLKIYRPLLSFKKEELNKYCASKNIKPMIDILNKSGKLIVVHSCGNDSVSKVIKLLWPKETPFPTPARSIIKYLKNNKVVFFIIKTVFS